MYKEKEEKKEYQEVLLNERIEEIDKEILGEIRKEIGRKRNEIEMIDQEKIVQRDVMEEKG